MSTLFTEEEFLSIIHRCGYYVECDDYGMYRAVKEVSTQVIHEKTPYFGMRSKYSQLKRIAAYLLEKSVE